MFFKPKSIQEKEVRKALGRVQHSLRGESLAALGMVSGIVVKPGEKGSSVTVVLEVAEGDHALMPRLKEAAEGALMSLKGVAEARAIFTASAAPRSHHTDSLPLAERGRGEASSPVHERNAKQRVPLETAHLGKIIAVISGKGGVGKSTVAANLAVTLAQKGLRVGLLDADIYGPSVPRLFGLSEKPESEGGKIMPHKKYGLSIMSIGFLVEEGMPVIWRGAMVHTALKQLVQDVAWGALDALVLDMPPGTGDAPLTLMQSLKLAGAVIVSTPQDLALIDARKAIAMFRRMEVPVLGVVENMSTFICPHCGGGSAIFGHGGAREEAAKIGEAFLGEIPLTLSLRETSDAGTPITALEPESETSRAFQAIAESVWKKAGG